MNEAPTGVCCGTHTNLELRRKSLQLVGQSVADQICRLVIRIHAQRQEKGDGTRLSRVDEIPGIAAIACF